MKQLEAAIFEGLGKTVPPECDSIAILLRGKGIPELRNDARSNPAIGRVEEPIVEEMRHSIVWWPNSTSGGMTMERRKKRDVQWNFE